MSILRTLTRLTLTAAFSTAAFCAGHAYADSYNSSNLIDESIFINNNTMSQTDIQNFLNSKGGALARQNFGTDSNGVQSAAWIISYVSQHVGLNPQTILATLQKEQSLITDPSPDASQYNHAMGYGCFDSTPGCTETGFFNQVIDGGWQLRFNFEKAGGNSTSWTAPDGRVWSASKSYACAGSTRYYSTGLYSGRNVTFYDDAGNAYVNLTLANRSTASMYCYTPHVYPGSGTQYYSGSKNFVSSFLNWWGAVHINAYSAGYAGQSSYPTIAPGSSGTAYFMYRNNGSSSWYDDSSIGGAPAGNYPTHLATSQPLNRADHFGSTWGANQNRPALTFAAVYESNGTTLAANQHIVQPGQIAKFSFTLSVTSSMPAGTYREYFTPVADGTPDGAFNDPGTYLDITVSPTYRSAYHSQGTAPTLKPGQSITTFFAYTNSGNTPWYDDLSMYANPGGYPTHLITSNAVNRSSIFGSGWNTNKNRPSNMFEAVYESNGTTLATNQHVVQPGQIGRYAITFTAPAQQAANTYREYFMPVQDGTPDGAMNDPGTYMDVVVSAATVGTSTASAETAVSTTPGVSRQYTASFVNTGNTTWTSSTTNLLGNPATSYQSFKASGWPSSTVIAHLNETSVAPGATGTFTFTLTAPNSGGTYALELAPSNDGNYFSPAPAKYRITVSAPVYKAGFSGQSAYPTMFAGGQYQAYFSYKNNGNITWYDDISIGSAPAGSYPVHLATSHNINRRSAFGAQWGANGNRPVVNFTAVYESDGTTLASNQHQVDPGQIAKMAFTFTAANSQSAGTFVEFFQPVADGTPDGAFNDPGTYLETTITPKIYSAQFNGQSVYPTVTAGSTTTGYFSYKNNGNQTWYDDSSIGGAPAGSYPVHLATAQPINRSSTFGATWGTNKNRPGLTFTTVYESNGTTLAANQHQVSPGQIAKFQFTFTAPVGTRAGSYREFFQPVADGTPDGAFNFVGTYFDVTVTP